MGDDRRFRNVGIFGTATRTNVLLAIHMLGETYVTELSGMLEISLNQAQHALASLEDAGLIVREGMGRLRRVQLNPRSVLTPEISALLDKMAHYDVPLQKRLAERRRRPRKTGKEL